METLRINLYNEIEKLETELKNFDVNEYGYSEDEEALIIKHKIKELEVEISETWIK